MKKLYAPILALALIISGSIYFNSFAQPENEEPPVTATESHSFKAEHSTGENEHEGGMEPLFFVIIALIIGAATRHFLKKSPIPYTVMLFILGLLMGIANRLGYFGSESVSISIDWAGHIDPHIILFVFLPTLIFEGAFALDVHTFKKTAVNSLLLAVPGLVLALFLTGAMVMGINNAGIGLTNWNWQLALMFGALISATDPVAVVALLKELGASKKISTLIDGEAILNDGTGIVLFMVFFLPITGAMSDSSAVANFLYVSVGGAIVGFLVAAICIGWVKRVFNDALVEISVIVAAAYLTFFLCEHFFHVSGVIGLFALGLSMAGTGRTKISPEVEHFLHEFWGIAAFIANTLIFILVGVVISSQAVFGLQDFIVLGIIYIGLHVVRGLMILFFFPIMRKSGYGLNFSEAIVLWYGALRGGVGLALALVVAGVDDKYIPAEIRHQFLFLTAGIVVLTLLINATTAKLIIDALGLTKIPAVKKLMLANAYESIKTETEKSLDLLHSDKFMSGANWNSVREYLPHLTIPEISNEELSLSLMDKMAEVRRRILEKEKSSYWHQFKNGLLGDEAVQRLNAGISEMLDFEGKIPLSERKYIDKLWAMPKILGQLQSIPVLNSFSQNAFSERLALSYDIAKGFVVAQEEVVKSVKGFSENAGSIASIEDEVNENRIKGLIFLNGLRESYPEISAAIETKQAIRSMLNNERTYIKRMEKDGRIESDEAASMMAMVEERMQKLMFHPPSVKLPDTVQLLQEIPWLQGLDDATFSKVLNLAQSKNYSVGGKLMEQGGAGDGMFIIARGTVKVTVNNFLVDILGAGSVIGEMAVLMGVPRTATITADSPVTALWLTSSGMHEIMKSSKVLEEQLWKTAGTRFCENFLGKLEPYQQWTQIDFRRWLSEGKVSKTKSGETISLTDKIAVVVSGQVLHKGMSINSPVLIKSGEIKFISEGRVFVR